MALRAQATVLSVLIVFWGLFESSQCSTYCYDLFECSFDTIDDDNVYCNGYYGCYAANINCDKLQGYGAYAIYSGTIDASSTVECEGILGCAYSTIDADGDVDCQARMSCIGATVTSTDGEATCGGEMSCVAGGVAAFEAVKCQGYQSCRASTIVSSISYIDCEGEESCYASTLVLDSSESVFCYGKKSCAMSEIPEGPYYVLCQGYEACYGAEITDVDQLSIDGPYGFAEGVFFNNPGNVLTAYFSGYRASEYAYILCYEGSACEVNCVSDTGCADLTVYCFGQGTCNIVCQNYTGSCQDCPTVIPIPTSASVLSGGSSLSGLSSSAWSALHGETGSEQDAVRTDVRNVLYSLNGYVEKVLTDEVNAVVAGQTSEAVEEKGKDSSTNAQSLIDERLTEVNQKIGKIEALFEKKMKLIERWGH